MLKKTVLREDYGFDEAFNIFDDIDNKYNKIYDYRPRAPNKIKSKNIMLKYLKLMSAIFCQIFIFHQMIALQKL